MDTHFHLTDQPFSQNPGQMITQAQKNGVPGLLVPCYNIESCHHLVSLKKQFPGIRTALGLHPLFINEIVAVKDVLKTFLQQTSWTAIGEIGLDYRRNVPDRNLQKSFFSIQLALALEVNLPIIIHCVGAHQDCLKCIEQAIIEYGRQPQKRPLGIIHRANCSLDEAARYKQLGFMFGLGPDLLDTRRKKLIKLASWLDPEDIVLETDAPYCLDGQRQVALPWTVFKVRDRLAEIRNESIESLTLQINKNTDFLG